MSTEATAGAHLSIGEVLDQLRSEFPDVTISKIRFLESQGLIDPERTPSGYRRFYPPDLQRLRWILLQQRDHFLPLRVIKERLDAFGPSGAPRIGSANGGAQAANDASTTPAPASAPFARRPDAPTPDARTPAPPIRPLPTPTAPPPVPATPQVTPAQRTSPSPSPSSVSSTAPRTAPPVAPRAAPSPPMPIVPPPGPRPTAPPTSAPEPAFPPRPTAPPAPARVAVADLNDAVDTEDDEDQVGSVHRGRDVAASTDLTRGELLEATGLTDSQVDALESFGILVALVDSDGRARYDDEMLAIAELAAGCYRRGIEARHLKMYWHFAEREAALFSQVLLPYLRQRNPAARAKLQGELEELARLGRRLRTAMLRRALRTTLTE